MWILGLKGLMISAIFFYNAVNSLTSNKGPPKMTTFSGYFQELVIYERLQKLKVTDTFSKVIRICKCTLLCFD